MDGLNWLHLSDWHQKGKDFDRQVIRDALIEDIASRYKINPKLENIDFIIFSGDIAYHGWKEEYDSAARELFTPILELCKLRHDHLFIVPGNHDMDRELIKDLPDEFKKVPKQGDRSAINEWLVDSKKRVELMKPFKAFSRFVKKYTGQNQPDYANICKWKIKGKEIAVLGLNSAWMCARNKDSNNEISDKGFVIIGEPQVHSKLKDLSGADIKIIVIHHPFEWLIDFDSSKVEDWLKSKCNFIMCGHQHKPGIKVVNDSEGDYITIPAGSCYERRSPVDSEYANSYYHESNPKKEDAAIYPPSGSDLFWIAYPALTRI